MFEQLEEYNKYWIPDWDQIWSTKQVIEVAVPKPDELAAEWSLYNRLLMEYDESSARRIRQLVNKVVDHCLDVLALTISHVTCDKHLRISSFFGPLRYKGCDCTSTSDRMAHTNENLKCAQKRYDTKNEKLGKRGQIVLKFTLSTLLGEKLVENEVVKSHMLYPSYIAFT